MYFHCQIGISFYEIARFLFKEKITKKKISNFFNYIHFWGKNTIKTVGRCINTIVYPLRYTRMNMQTPASFRKFKCIIMLYKKNTLKKISQLPRVNILHTYCIYIPTGVLTIQSYTSSKEIKAHNHKDRTRICVFGVYPMPIKPGLYAVLPHL